MLADLSLTNRRANERADIVLGEDWDRPPGAVEQELKAARARRNMLSLNRSPLSRKIILFNLLAMVVLVAGVMYLNPFRDSLAVQRERAHAVLETTGCAAVMIGRGAQGSPWLFADIQHYLKHGTEAALLPIPAIHELVRDHLCDIHAFYGSVKGVFFARKHIAWYLNKLASRLDADNPQAGMSATLADWRRHFNTLEDGSAQVDTLDRLFENLTEKQQKQPLKELAA